MDGCQPQTQEFPAPKKVAQISGGKIAAGVAVAVWVNWFVHFTKGGVADIAPAMRGEQSPVPGNACGQGTVKDINPPGDTFNNILR
jgi:hypothetical protein